MKIKKKILVTHWDHNIDPEIFEISGRSDKKNILDVYYKSEKIIYALGEDDKFSNDVWEGNLTEQQLLEKIPFETLNEFLKHLNSISEYTFKVIY